MLGWGLLRVSVDARVLVLVHARARGSGSSRRPSGQRVDKGLLGTIAVLV